jgi:hypothetical protein
MIIGQIEQMKMQKIAAGSARSNTPDRQPGQRRHRPQHADDRQQRAIEQAEAPEHETQRNADQRRQAEAGADTRHRLQQVPAHALVVGTVAVERMLEQQQRRTQRAQRPGQVGRNTRHDRPGQDQAGEAQQRRHRRCGFAGVTPPAG